MSENIKVKSLEDIAVGDMCIAKRTIPMRDFLILKDDVFLVLEVKKFFRRFGLLYHVEVSVLTSGIVFPRLDLERGMSHILKAN
jgi:hypothetical protein